MRLVTEWITLQEGYNVLDKWFNPGLRSKIFAELYLLTANTHNALHAFILPTHTTSNTLWSRKLVIEFCDLNHFSLQTLEASRLCCKVKFTPGHTIFILYFFLLKRLHFEHASFYVSAINKSNNKLSMLFRCRINIETCTRYYFLW